MSKFSDYFSTMFDVCVIICKETIATPAGLTRHTRGFTLLSYRKNVFWYSLNELGTKREIRREFNN